MLRLDLARGARWFDLGHGVRVQCEPVTTTIIAAARRDPDVAALGADADHEELGLALALAVARRVITGWEGVGDAEGRPIPVSREGIGALLDIWPIHEAFQGRVLSAPMLVESEKNGSAPSPNGTSAAGASTARPAKGRAPSARAKSTRRKP